MPASALDRRRSSSATEIRRSSFSGSLDGMSPPLSEMDDDESEMDSVMKARSGDGMRTGKPHANTVPSFLRLGGRSSSAANPKRIHCYEFVVDIALAPGMFHQSRVLTVSPRFLIQNNTASALLLGQLGTPAITLPAGEHPRAFHWNVRPAPPCIRRVRSLPISGHEMFHSRGCWLPRNWA